MAVTFSPGSNWKMLLRWVPLAVRLASGIWYPFFRYTRPELVKKRILSWLEAVKRVST